MNTQEDELDQVVAVRTAMNRSNLQLIEELQIRINESSTKDTASADSFSSTGTKTDSSFSTKSSTKSASSDALSHLSTQDLTGLLAQSASFEQRLSELENLTSLETKREAMNKILEDLAVLNRRMGKVVSRAEFEDKVKNKRLFDQQEQAYKKAHDELSDLLKIDKKQMKELPDASQALFNAAKKALVIIESVKREGKVQTPADFQGLIDLTETLKGMHTVIKAHQSADPKEIAELMGTVTNLTERLDKLPKSALWSHEAKAVLAIAAVILFLAVLAAAAMLAAGTLGAGSPLSVAMVVGAGAWLGSTLTALGVGFGAFMTSTLLTIPGMAGVSGVAVPTWAGLAGGVVGAVGLPAMLVGIGSRARQQIEEGYGAQLIKVKQLPQDTDALLHGSLRGIIAVAPDGQNITNYYMISKGLDPKEIDDPILKDDLITKVNKDMPELRRVNLNDFDDKDNSRVFHRPVQDSKERVVMGEALKIAFPPPTPAPKKEPVKPVADTFRGAIDKLKIKENPTAGPGPNLDSN